MRSMILRFLAVGFLALLLTRPASADNPMTVQEALLRAKPAVVLIISEVSAEVTLNCGSGVTKVTPPVFRETGTGWVIDGGGWGVTNGHGGAAPYGTARRL